MRRVTLALVLGLLVGGGQAVAQTSDWDKAKAAYEAAQANPGDDTAFAAYLATLPQHRNLATGEIVYLIEGDMARSAREVRAYLRARQGQPEAPRNSELKLHSVHGVPMCWAAAEYRTIRFAVFKPSFDQALNDNGAGYTKTLEAMTQAGSDWQAVCPDCGIRFVHVPTLDTPAGTFQEQIDALFAAISEDRIRFFVYYEANKPSLYARAFFPGDPVEKRTLLVAKATLDTFAPGRPANAITARGVLRHELGHVLGYRHEHIAAPFGCKKEPDLINTPKNITVYDKQSVMHYDCGPSASKGDDVISDLDKVGHRKVYGPQQPGHMCGTPMAGLVRP